MQGYLTLLGVSAAMRIVLRFCLLVFCVSLLLSVGAFAQRNGSPASQQNDNMDSPLLRQRAREHSAVVRAGSREAPEADDPTARLEWQRRDRGIPSVAFRKHVLNLQR